MFQAMIHYDLLKNRRMILKENNLMLLWLNDLMMNLNQHPKTRNAGKLSSVVSIVQLDIQRTGTWLACFMMHASRNGRSRQP